MNYYVLGAGISGLVTAYELSKKGCNVCIIEKESVPGGLARTLKWHGLPVDLGPHIYHTANREVESYWKKEFRGLFVERDHWCKNFQNGVYHDYPVSHESIERLPEYLRDAIKEELKNRDDFGHRSARNYYEYIRALAGETLQKLFFICYPEKLWGMPVKELDANWAPKRLEIRKNITPFYWKQWSGVGIEGSGSIINKLYKSVKNRGCKTFLGEEVKRLDISNDSIRRIVTDKRTINVDADDVVINTLPCTITSTLLGHQTDLRYRGAAIVYILARKKPVFPKGVDFVYFDDPNVLFHRISLQSSFVKQFPRDKEVYICEIAYSKGDQIDRKKKDILIAEVVSQFESLGLIRKNEIIDTRIEKLTEVYPSFFTGYRDSLAKTIASIENISNLYTVGSLAEYDYSDLQILFSKAMDLVEVLTDKTFKVNKMNKNNKRVSFMEKVGIKGRIVGEGSPAFIIAEAGLNHNGDMKLARQLIDEAVRSKIGRAHV